MIARRSILGPTQEPVGNGEDGGMGNHSPFSPPPPPAEAPPIGGMMPPGGDIGNNPPNDMPAPGGATVPDVHRPGGQDGPPMRDTTSPREQHPGAPGPGNGGMGTPPMPSSPTPIAGGAPQPFTPIPGPPMAGGVQRVTPSLYGKAGGLLGGGIGVQDAGNPGMDANNPDILRLLQLLGVK